MVLSLGIAGLAAAADLAVANNVTVANVDLKSPGGGAVKAEFDLAWENAWRDASNYDACWVFVKYSVDAGVTWSHATMAASGTNPAGTSGGTGTGLDIVVPSDKKGAFIQRAAVGSGAVVNTDVQLVWDFATDGVLPSQSARIKVFAIEMVYVPEGSFYVGDGTTTTLRGHFEAGTSGAAFQITGEGAITLGGGGAGSLGNNNASGMETADDFNDSTSQTLPAAFPKGYAAFYLMKTEISQGQYCDFLNTLTATQQGSRHDSALHFAQYRNFIKKTSASPAVFGCDADNDAGPSNAVTNVELLNESTDGEWVACNYLSWYDGAAYIDWAALRPMTELEFEKACRGTTTPVADQYAWGSTNLETATASLTGGATTDEAPNQGNCNYSSCSPDGPYRCGSYADASSTRQNAGAGYDGCLDLSGNLNDRAVSVGITSSRAFTGAHGNGALNSSGSADVTGWPSSAVGIGVRGGLYNQTADYARVSDRFRGAVTWTGRYNTYGSRGARSTP
jgi:formylglycine-generating enzyme required for sulfatase activity